MVTLNTTEILVFFIKTIDISIKNSLHEIIAELFAWPMDSRKERK